MAQDIGKQAQEYYQLVHEGMPPAQAFKQAFPNGVPTALDRQKELAADKQKQGYGQIAGALAGLAGTKYLIDKVPSFFGTKAAEETGKALAKEASANLTQQAASQTAQNAGSSIAGNSASTFDIGGNTMYPGGASYPAAPGVEAVQPGMVAPGISTAISAAAALKGGYDTYNSLQNGGQGIRGAATTTGAGIGGAIGSIVPGIGTAIGSGAGAAIGNIAGYGLQGDGFKNDLALAPFTFGATLIPGVGDKLRGALVHKTTKQHQSERWADMAQSEDPATAAYAQQYLDVIAQGDGSGKTFEDIIGQEGGGSGRDVWGASAFFDAFKDKGGWLNTTEAQREQIAKQALDQGLLTGDHGDIVATDDDALNKIKLIGDEVLGIKTQSPMAQALSGVTQKLPAGIEKPIASKPVDYTNGLAANYPGIRDSMYIVGRDGPAISGGIIPDWKGVAQSPFAAAGAQKLTPMVQALSRSNTLSPGIDKNGRRIAY